MTHVLAVDGGGTKTAAALHAAADGRLLATARGGPSNLFQDLAGGIAAVAETWRACCAKAGLDPDRACRTACLSAGLAGSGTPGAAPAFKAAFSGFARVRLSSDGHIALIGAHAGRPGALLIVGTGVVGHRLTPAGRFEELGGWGFPVGDRGGGAWLGLQLVGDWLERTEGGPGDGTPWTAELAMRLGRDRPAILGWLSRARPADYAALAPLLLSAAAAGDLAARARLSEGAGHVLALARALEPCPEALLCLVGGLAPTYAPALVAALGADSVLADRAVDPLEGARLIGLGLAPAEHEENA